MLGRPAPWCSSLCLSCGPLCQDLTVDTKKSEKQREYGDLGGLVEGAARGKQLACSDDPGPLWRGVRLHADAPGGAGAGSSSA